MHPAHIPFEAETQTAKIGGARDGRPGSRFFGDGEGAGKSSMDDFIHVLNEGDGWEIFAAAKFVGNPLAGFAGVIEIEHGSDGVNAETVEVIFVEPEEGVGNQIVLDFVAAVVVDERAPVGMGALARIGVLVKMGAVKICEAVSVAGKMSGSPIKEDADAGLMTAVDKLHELGGGTMAAGGGEIAESLVAPGTVEGMLHYREQFDVGVAEIFYVGDELVGEFAIREPAIVLLGDAAPRAEVDLVDGNGGFEPIFLRALFDPRRVVPSMVVERSNYGTGVGPELGAESVGVCFEREDISIGTDDFIFVDGAFR